MGIRFIFPFAIFLLQYASSLPQQFFGAISPSSGDDVSSVNTLQNYFFPTFKAPFIDEQGPDMSPIETNRLLPPPIVPNGANFNPPPMNGIMHPPSIRPQPPAPPRPGQLAAFYSAVRPNSPPFPIGGPFQRVGGIRRRPPTVSMCPKWSDWETSKCFWPGKLPYAELPESCKFDPIPDDVPAILKSFAEAKKSEEFDKMSSEFHKLSINQPCGMCARQFQCRMRNHTRPEMPGSCIWQQTSFLKEPECDAPQPCKMTPIDGGCPSPKFFSSAHQKFRGHGAQQQDINMEVPPMRTAADLQKFFRQQIDEKMKEMFNNTLTDRPPMWNCIKNKTGSQCLCCCDFYLPDANTEKCVSIIENIMELVDNKTESIFPNHASGPELAAATELIMA